MNQKSNRLEEIDYLKGLGILLMVVGHIQFSETLNIYIYSFHMPLFFIISGYLYKDNDLSIGAYIKKQTVNLLLPYVFFGVFFTALFIAFGHQLDWRSIATCFVSPNHNPFDWCGPIWFLLAMFFIKIVFDFLRKYLNKYLFFVCSIVISTVGATVSLCNMKLALCLDSALVGYGFYCCGYLYKRNKHKVDAVLNRIPKWICFISLAVGSLVCYWNAPINMRVNTYGNFFLFTISALSGTAFWALLMTCVKNYLTKIGRILKTLNNYSISYMGMNQFIIAILNVFAISRLNHSIICLSAQLIELFVVIAVIAIVSNAINKTKLRILIGKKA